MSNCVTNSCCCSGIGGKTKTIKVIPTISTSIYASNDAIGGRLDFDLLTCNNTGVIQSLIIIDKAKQSSAMELHLFNYPFTINTADNATYSPDATEVVNYCIGVISISTGDWLTNATTSIATIKSIGLAINGTDGINYIYARLVSKGTPTYTSTSDLTLKLTVLQD